MSYTNRTRTLALLSTITLACGAMGLGMLPAPGIEREGDADHVSAVQALECAPFDTALFDGLDRWSLGQPLNASAIDNKVVLIGFVNSGNPQSLLALSTLARYARQNSDEGLVVLAVQPELGWDALQEKIDSGRVKVQAARDTGNAFMEAMGSDDTPDFYLIDRAGQLRYADLQSRSLKSAIGQLLRETKDEAIANAKLQSEGIDVADGIGSESAAPEDDYTPTPEDYATANWPAPNTGKLSAKDFQGKPLPVALGNEEWLTEKKDLEGKVLILDFWATWCGPCRAASPKLEELQEENEGKLEVLAIGGSNDDERAHKRYVFQTKHAYSNLYDKEDNINQAMGVRAIPHSVVISTDGVIRWQGNPLNPKFKDIVEQVIAVDPMLSPKKTTKTGMGNQSNGVPAEAYASADWPAHNRGRINAQDFQGQPLPVPLGNEKWLDDEVDTSGKVIVLDFWATWCGPCKAFSPIANKLQVKNRDRMQILAIGGQSESESTMRDYLDNHRKVAYSHLFDANQSIYRALGVRAIPHAVILSTDGVIRWQGNPHDPNFERALDKVMSVDPGVEGN